MTRRIALLFPGQGVQMVGMGRLAADRFPVAREVFSRVDAALAAPIAGICFEGPLERLQETRWQQPAIFACSLAMHTAWRSSLSATDRVVGAAGHSLGEYAALVAAGALSLEDAARLVLARGAAMQEAADRQQGGMAAILGLDQETVSSICRAASDASGDLAELVVLANDNAPGQQVISGGLPALERACAEAKARGARRVVRLKVAGAFHSPLMAPAVPALDAAFDRPAGQDSPSVAIQPLDIPVVANSTCEWLRDGASVRAELVRQVTSPVRWVESVRALAALEPDLWLDCGPGDVMQGLVARIVPGARTLTLSSTIDVPDPGALAKEPYAAEGADRQPG